MKTGLALTLAGDCEPMDCDSVGGGYAAERVRRHRMLVIAATPLVIIGGLLAWLIGRWLVGALAVCGCWQSALGWAGGGIIALMLLLILAFLWWCLFGDDYQAEPWERSTPEAPSVPFIALPAPTPRAALPDVARRLLPAPKESGWRVIVPDWVQQERRALYERS